MNKTLGMMIASLRKGKGLTQLELADKMGVTDKAVSKWERDISYPNIDTIKKLANIFGISVDELMQSSNGAQEKRNNNLFSIIHIILKAIALAMGIGVVVLTIINELNMNSGMTMLGVGLSCLAMDSLKNNV